jgi:hypothetical protein
MDEFQEDRDEIRDHAKENIGKMQEESRCEFNRKRKKALTYCENDLVALSARSKDQD